MQRKLQSKDIVAATAASLTVGAAVGIVTFYVARIFLAREEIGVPGSERALPAGRDHEAVDALSP